MATSWSSWYWHLPGASSLVMAGAIAFFADCALAQITPDDTLGAESSVATPNVVINGITTNQIDGGAIRGANLFHSFEQFSIPTGGAAYFNNALDIQNIISRVTGKSISNIDGLLQANGTANLFLLNPNGIIFGPNATLAIGGSFVGSTASSLNFESGTLFSATAPQATPLLTVSVPLGLQFGANAGSIQVQGNGQGIRTTIELIDTTGGLRVQPEQTLALVGSDVALSGGTLKTAGGRIELGSVAGPSLVSLTSTDKGLALGYEGVQNFRDIQLSQQAAVDASGAGGGDIQVWGRRVTLSNGSQIEASTLGSQPGGTLTVRASELMELIGRSADGQLVTALAVQVYPGATGAGGNINLETGQLIVRDGARISTVTFGQGKAGNLAITTRALSIQAGAVVSTGTAALSEGQGGNLVVTASDSVNLVGSSSGLSNQNQGASAAGDLSITTGQLRVQGGAVVSTGTYSTSKEGQGGDLTVTASESVELFGTSGLFTETQGAPDAGDLTITTRRLSVGDGARISASTSAEGGGGNLAVSASDSVKLFGTSGLFTQTQGAGNAGDLTIATRDLSVENGAVVSAFSPGQGNSGDIKVDASNSVNLFGVSPSGSSSGLFTRTEGGLGGNITVNTSAFRIANGAVVDARTLAAKNGGNITVNGNTFEAVNGGQVLTTTRSSGQAGNISLNVTDSVTLFGSDPTYADRLAQFGRDEVDNEGPASGLFANTAQGSTGAGGSISIDPIKLTIINGAGIAVDSQGQGNAGNLHVQAGSVTLDNGAFLSAETTSGSGGNITLKVQELLLMRHNSNISATAGTAQAGGDGGNIDIDTDLLVAIPSENSDITANAFQGRGGNIKIATQGIFGIQFREQPTPESDVTVSSDFGVDGVVEINTPDVDPNQGLVALPTELVDASELVASGCEPAGRFSQSEFIITGRGGLPPNPSDTLSSDTVWTDLRPLTKLPRTPSSSEEATNPTSSYHAPIVEATGWVINNKGEVVLTTTAPTLTPHSPWMTTTHLQCAR